MVVWPVHAGTTRLTGNIHRKHAPERSAPRSHLIHPRGAVFLSLASLMPGDAGPCAMQIPSGEGLDVFGLEGRTGPWSGGREDTLRGALLHAGNYGRTSVPVAQLFAELLPTVPRVVVPSAAALEKAVPQGVIPMVDAPVEEVAGRGIDRYYRNDRKQGCEQR